MRDNPVEGYPSPALVEAIVAVTTRAAVVTRAAAMRAAAAVIISGGIEGT